MNYFLLIVSAPFLFFLPGYWIMQRWGKTDDTIERFILSVFLSLAMMYGGIFAVEKLFDKITAGRVTMVVIGINLFCLAFTFFRRRH